MADEYDVIIIGGGPAGLTAGLYLGRAKYRALIIDQGVIGGQIILTHSVANYPGTGEIAGYELAGAMKKQAMEFGCDIIGNTEIVSFDFSGDVKTITTDDDETFSARAVIIAAGGRPRGLGLESEINFRGRGVSYCATCDGDFFQDKEIVVIGGGNSALEEAVSLTAYASKVTIVHMLDNFQGHPHAIDGAVNHDNIDIMMETVVDEFIGEETLDAVRVRDLKTGSVKDIQAKGAFIFTGYVPNTDMFRDMVQCNGNGEIITNEDMSTSLAGVYAAGDCRAKKFRQITSAVSDGTIAALGTIEYLVARPEKTGQAAVDGRTSPVQELSGL